MADESDRRAAIMEQAAALFARKGISGTTVREIADAVGILSGSLYHHFKSKDEMVHAIVSEYLVDLIDRYEKVLASGAEPEVMFEDLVRVSLAVIEAHPHATEIYQTSGAALSAHDEEDRYRTIARTIQRCWIQVLEKGVAAGKFRDDIPSGVQYRLIRDSLGLSVRWFRPAPAYDMEQFARDLTTIFLRGIQAP